MESATSDGSKWLAGNTPTENRGRHRYRIPWQSRLLARCRTENGSLQCVLSRVFPRRGARQLTENTWLHAGGALKKGLLSV